MNTKKGAEESGRKRDATIVISIIELLFCVDYNNNAWSVWFSWVLLAQTYQHINPKTIFEKQTKRRSLMPFSRFFLEVPVVRRWDQREDGSLYDSHAILPKKVLNLSTRGHSQGQIQTRECISHLWKENHITYQKTQVMITTTITHSIKY